MSDSWIIVPIPVQALRPKRVSLSCPDLRSSKSFSVHASSSPFQEKLVKKHKKSSTNKSVPTSSTARQTVFRSWRPDEDSTLQSAVSKVGPKHWVTVAESMPDRTPKQCRERWINHLQPDLRRGGWSTEEDALIVQGHRMHSNHWTKIAGLLVGRTDNAVKNRWNSTMRRVRRRAMSDTGPGTSSSVEGVLSLETPLFRYCYEIWSSSSSN